MMLLADAAPPAPSAREVMARAETENFPVASRVLPRRARAHLLAVYGFARLVDELGDSAPGDRLAALDWLEGELDRAFAGTAEHPLMRRLSLTVRECDLSREPFARLIEANRTDQRVARYETWEQLRGYCALSADPVGEIVLGVFGVATQARVALSDSICTALQLAEHCQDVAEDYAAGRVYLPREDLERFGCELESTGLKAADALAQSAGAAVAVAPTASPSYEQQRLASERLRDVLGFEVARGRRLLDEGAPLIDQLHGRERLAVAAFHAGGRAAFAAIERAGFNVLDEPPTASTPRRLQALLATLLKRPAATE
ncbi:MAG TPA: squalene synthase HpnC [Solirubrobacteraceae bacterium]|jgi:squalene synthase HpnC|nr:squalene synthase HpnC [Solirubrobacteraceae bacterium]